jgi:hypothetical protein
MSWTYVQSTGHLFFNDELIYENGYSGKGIYKNSPNMEHLTAKGPIPKGEYKISEPRKSTNTGPYVLPLSPVGHNAWGRSAFQIHGDSIKNPGTASSGCIILPRYIRTKI